MGMFDSLLHPERAYEKAQEEMEKYYQQALGFQQPYIDQGQNAYGGLSSAMQALLNPEGLQSQWTQGYEATPYALQTADLAKQHGLNAASSMGVMGSTPAMQAMQSGTTQIMLNDRQNYLDQLMNKYLAGIGIAGNIYNTGANASSQSGQYAMGMGDSSAMNAANQYAAPGRMMGSLLGTGATLGASALGGPIGGAVANKFIGNYQPWSTGGY